MTDEERAKAREDCQASMSLCEGCEGDGWKTCPQERRGHFLAVNRDGRLYPCLCKVFAEACRSGAYRFNVEDYPELSPEHDHAVSTQSHCKVCAGLDDCRNQPKGHYTILRWDEPSRYFYGSLAPCRLQRAKVNMDRLMQRMGQANIGTRFLDRTFQNFREDMFNGAPLQTAINYAEGYSRETKNGVLLSGPVGTGKTHLAVAILIRIIERGYAGAYESVNDIIRKLGSSYQTDTTESYTDTLKSEPLLVLDDLGKERSNDTARTFVYSLINSRYEGSRPTIITTNLTPAEIRETYGDAIHSRLCEMCDLVAVKGDDHRRVDKYIGR